MTPETAPLDDNSLAWTIKSQIDHDGVRTARIRSAIVELKTISRIVWVSDSRERARTDSVSAITLMTKTTHADTRIAGVAIRAMARRAWEPFILAFFQL